MKSLLIILSVFTVISAQNKTISSERNRKINVCPKHFVRIGRMCYFFSRNSATWQDAYYRCREKKSYIATIKTAKQDNHIRKILSRPTHATYERWLGGMYNWKQMKWIWAASGKPLTYEGFASKNHSDTQKWNCITMDPKLKYRWNTKPCIEAKPYICHTKTKSIYRNNKFRKPVNTDRHLNEIPLAYTKHQNHQFSFKEYPADFQYKTAENSLSRYPPRQKRRRKNRRKKRINNATILLQRPKYVGVNVLEKDSKDFKDKKSIPMETIKYEIYKDDIQMKSSLYPKPIVEEYSVVKDTQNAIDTS